MPNLIEPAFGAGSVNLAFISSAAFAPYASVAVASALHHASPTRLYDVMVLTPGMEEADRAKIESLAEGRANVNLRVVDVSSVAAWVEEKVECFHVDEHWFPGTYYRVFTPSLFTAYDRLVCLDSDVLFLADPAGLFDFDLKGKAAGASREPATIAFLLKHPNGWWARQLRLRDPGGYANVGVLLLDLAKMRREGCETKCLRYLSEVAEPRVLEQDALNHALEGDLEPLDQTWNATAPWFEALGKGLRPGEVAEPLWDEYRESARHPKLLHYVSTNKPWHNPHIPWADKWWEVARETPYREWLRDEALNNAYREVERLKMALRPSLGPRAKRRLAWCALVARLAKGPARARWQARLQEAKDEYRFLTRERFVPQSKFMDFLKDFLRV